MKTCSKCGEVKTVDGFRVGKNQCKACISEYLKQWRLRNKEHVAEQQKQYREENKEQKNEYDKQYSEENKESKTARNKQWFKDNPEKKREYNQRRRARKINAPGYFTTEQFIELCEQYENKCLCCGEAGKLTADHVVPLSKGGSNYIENIQPLCQSCNSSKYTKAIDYRPVEEYHPLTQSSD